MAACTHDRGLVPQTETEFLIVMIKTPTFQFGDFHHYYGEGPNPFCLFGFFCGSCPCLQQPGGELPVGSGASFHCGGIPWGCLGGW